MEMLFYRPYLQRRAMAEDLALKFYAAIGGGDSSEEETAAGQAGGDSKT